MAFLSAGSHGLCRLPRVLPAPMGSAGWKGIWTWSHPRQAFVHGLDLAVGSRSILPLLLLQTKLHLSPECSPSVYQALISGSGQWDLHQLIIQQFDDYESKGIQSNPHSLLWLILWNFLNYWNILRASPMSLLNMRPASLLNAQSSTLS